MGAIQLLVGSGVFAALVWLLWDWWDRQITEPDDDGRCRHCFAATPGTHHPACPHGDMR